MSQRFGLSRVELDAFALESHRRAIAAGEEGRFDAEVAPVGGVERDEGPRPDASAEKLAALPTLPGYPEVTAGIASQISAVMVASAAAIERHGLTPLARIVDMIGIDSEPIEMLSGPIPATALILKRNGLALSDIDPSRSTRRSPRLSWAGRRRPAPRSRRRTSTAGAIALGHPLGAAGTKIVANIAYTLRDREADRGLVAICEGGGTANAMLIERV